MNLSWMNHGSHLRPSTGWRRGRPAIVASLALVLAAPVVAQTSSDENWQELATAPPAQFSLDQLQSIEMGAKSSLSYGLDPATLTVGADGVVRYVLVARSPSGALNVLFEGIRCKTAAVKTYARWDNVGAWNISADAAWRPLAFSGSTRHAMQLAREGICDGPTPNGTADRILRSLRTGRSDNR